MFFLSFLKKHVAFVWNLFLASFFSWTFPFKSMSNALSQRSWQIIMWKLNMSSWHPYLHAKVMWKIIHFCLKTKYINFVFQCGFTFCYQIISYLKFLIFNWFSFFLTAALHTYNGSKCKHHTRPRNYLWGKKWIDVTKSAVLSWNTGYMGQICLQVGLSWLAQAHHCLEHKTQDI